jgi:hypothetical protein
VPVDPAVIEACANGQSHGVFVQDDTGSEYSRDGEAFTWHLFPNRYVASRDMNAQAAPYFLLWIGAAGPNHTPSAPAASAPMPSPPVGTLPPPVVEPTAPPSAAEGPELTDLLGRPLGSRLTAARNEAVAFFVDRKPGELVELEAAGLPVRLWGLEQDALGPLTATGRVVGEITVPHGTTAGLHHVRIKVGERQWGLSLLVWDFTLPDTLSFVPEMNAYSLPCAPADERAWYRLAHEHRLNLNVLRYGWNGHVAAGCAPVERNGTWDWTAWDQRFGPLLDGSAFTGLLRSGVPVEAFYLPLNEHWPADVHRHFKGGYWIEEAFDDAYWQKFSAMAAEIAAHAHGRGWHQTELQFYLNNKVYFKEQRGAWSACSAPWVFDEPVNTQDFWALRRYGQEFNRAARSLAPNAVFRCDISRPEWQRDLLDGVTGLEVVSGALRTYRGRSAARREAWGTRTMLYGTTAEPADYAVQPAAWCLDAWCLGAEGVLPWQTIGSVASWGKPDALSLFYPPRDSNDPTVSPSVRLKIYRHGQQLVEYLTIFSDVTHQPRQALEAPVADLLRLHGAVTKKNAEDAGTSRYRPGIETALADLRTRLGAFLDTKHPPPRSRLITPKVRTAEKGREVVKK